MEERRVVVTGYDAITPAGCGSDALWHAVANGVPAGDRIAEWDVSGNVSRIGAAILDFEPAAYGIDPTRTAALDRSCQLALAAARVARAAAGIACGEGDPDRLGVCIGSAIGGIGFMEREYVRSARPDPSRESERTRIGRIDPHTYSAFLAYGISAEVAKDADARGPVTTMGTGCTAGLDAIGAAADLIQAGLADIMITGGVDAPLTPIVFTSFDNIKALTRRNDDPRRASRPFDRDRDGFLLSEGCGILILEEESHARRRGAEILGRVLAFASLCNAYHMTGLSADGEALAATLDACMRRARIDRGDVDYINAHGSSTRQNDRNETAAFKRAFGDHARRVPISSTKSVIGHSLGAASAIETIVCLQALRHGVIPPTANYENPSEDCDLDYVPNVARERPIRVAECNASGFSGIHSTLLVSSASRRVS